MEMPYCGAGSPSRGVHTGSVTVQGSCSNADLESEVQVQPESAFLQVCLLGGVSAAGRHHD